jgi:uncharacterized membrane protein
MASRSNQLFMASAVAGLLAMGAVAAPAHAEEDAGVKCYGINKCKGTGECGGKGHSCAGQNTCKGQGWLKLDKDTCLKIQGGRLTPEEAKS